jgi:hypothetical protein
MKAKWWRSRITRTERLLQVQVPQKLINKPSKPQPRGIVDYGEDARSWVRAPELQKADLAQAHIYVYSICGPARPHCPHCLIVFVLLKSDEFRISSSASQMCKS